MIFLIECVDVCVLLIGIRPMSKHHHQEEKQQCCLGIHSTIYIGIHPFRFDVLNYTNQECRKLKFVNSVMSNIGFEGIFRKINHCRSLVK